MKVFLILLTLSITFISCSSSSNDRQLKPNTHSEAYLLGDKHASDMLIQCSDTTQIQEYLLEIAARRSNIESHLGSQAATDYEGGFRNHIVNHNDTLAKMLF